MIGFFRKFRKDLTMKGNRRRYLVYGAGETILIITGILIAFQIDGWKEQRANRADESYYMQRLAEDFAFNGDEAQRNVSFSDFQRRNADLLISSMSSQLNPREQVEWLYALNHTWFLPHINYEDDTWIELQATGKLALISNRNLIREINAFYSMVARTKSLEAEWGDFNLSYRALVNEVIDDEFRGELLRGFSKDNATVSQPIDRAVDARPYIERLRDIPGIQGMISDIKINRTVGGANREALKTEIERIIGLIDRELEALSG